MIKLALMPYCDDCPYFEADVQKPGRVQKIIVETDEVVERNCGDTYVRCKNRGICEKVRRYLEDKMKRKDIDHEQQ